ncbi:hypothetical protein B0H14DRAFT_2609161 [Mycena olivaceomarginata]|nr:hypothetical protein B0H14DRAFT_2609161 [Mycena olivaceomarginata]
MKKIIEKVWGLLPRFQSLPRFPQINNTLRRSAVQEVITGNPLLLPELEQQICVSEFELPPRTTPADLPRWTASLTHLGLTHTLPRDPTAVLAALSALTHLGDTAIPVHLFALSPRLGCLILMTESMPEYERMRCYVSNYRTVRTHVHLRPIPDGKWDAWVAPYAGCGSARVSGPLAGLDPRVGRVRVWVEILNATPTPRGLTCGYSANVIRGSADIFPMIDTGNSYAVSLRNPNLGPGPYFL